MSHFGRFGRAVVLVVCAACGGPYANGKAFLLGQADHSGTRVIVLNGGDLVSEARTDATGAYRIRSPAGAHDLRFEHDGYQPVVQPDVVVQGNDVSVADVTLRAGAPIDSEPIASVQLAGKSKALVQFDHGFDSPTELVDLLSGTRRRVAAGPIKVLDADDRFATVRIDRLYRLDLATAALTPVEPKEAVSGFSAQGSYFYVGTDGNLDGLTTGAIQAAPIGMSICPAFPIFSSAPLSGAPGWILMSAISSCDSFRQTTVAMNPARHFASGPLSSIVALGGSAYLAEPSFPSALFQGPFTLRKLDLGTGVETTLKDGLSVVPEKSENGASLLLTWSSLLQKANYSLFDVRSGRITDFAFAATVASNLVGADFQNHGRLLTSETGSAVIRLDTGRATPLCTGKGNVLTIVPRDTSPFVRTRAVLCSSSGTVAVYDWDSDSARTLTVAATSGPAAVGPVVFWNEGQTTHAASIAGADPAVTVCATQASASVSASADGAVVALACADADGTGKWVAVDLRTGASQTILAASPASRAAIAVTRSAIGPTGRGVALVYSTNAPAADPVNCGSASCTWFFDRQANVGFSRNDLGTVPNLVPSPDDRGFLATDPALGLGRSLIVSFARSASPFAVVPGLLNQLRGIGQDGRFVLSDFEIADLASGEVRGLSNPAARQIARLGSSSDFTAAEGIIHLDTGTVESLGVAWQPLCEVAGSKLTFFDGKGSVLQQYEPGQDIRTVARQVSGLQGTPCSGTLLFTGDTPDGLTSLLTYSVGTGAVSTLAADVAPGIRGSGSHLFAFQHPDFGSGDLLVVSEDLASVASLKARAHLHTPFFESGDRVVFTGGSDTEDSRLVAANLDGSRARTIGPGADRVFLSLDGGHLAFEARGLWWMESPAGPGIALDDAEQVRWIAVSAAGDGLIYSVEKGERRGTYHVGLGKPEDGTAASPPANPFIFPL